MIKENLQSINHLIRNAEQHINEMIFIIKEGLINNDTHFLENIQALEAQINAIELKASTLCISTLALYQPEAKFLRLVVSSSHIIHALERIGDIAINITEKIVAIEDISSLDIPRLPATLLQNITHMLDLTLHMLNSSIQSYIEGDTKLAHQIFLQDNAVDDIRDEIINTIISQKEQLDIAKAIQIVNIGQNIERMADLCTTIAKNVVYITTGTLTEHSS